MTKTETPNHPDLDILDEILAMLETGLESLGIAEPVIADADDEHTQVLIGTSGIGIAYSQIDMATKAQLPCWIVFKRPPAGSDQATHAEPFTLNKTKAAAKHAIHLLVDQRLSEALASFD